MEEKIRLQRIRMLSAWGDFKLALSAADFFQEADEDEKYTLVELRRFKCYERTAVVSYARPFSQSKGETPKLSLKMCGVQLTPSEQAFHTRVINLRNKLIAHSDLEMMNFVSQTRAMPDVAEGFHSVLTRHDEGLQFYHWRDQSDLVNLIRKVSFALFDTIHNITKTDPGAFNLSIISKKID